MNCNLGVLHHLKTVNLLIGEKDATRMLLNWTKRKQIHTYKKLAASFLLFCLVLTVSFIFSLTVSPPVLAYHAHTLLLLLGLSHTLS